MSLLPIMSAIRNGSAEFIGEGDWVKDSAYQVYKVDGKFYSIIVYDIQSKWLMDESLEEIKEEEINKII